MNTSLLARRERPSFRQRTHWQHAESGPVLLMTGLHGRVFRTQEDVDSLAGLIRKRKSVVFADAGRLIPIEWPAKFTAELLAFAQIL